MTTITFGGGPNLEARRNFSNLKDGSELPGYRGYIHQIKYNSGHTYGNQTSILAKKFPNIKRHNSSLDLTNSTRDSLKPIILSNKLPNANGVNKLTESMVPGYTGYIPSRKFQFSNTYKNECDQCIDDFIDKKKAKSSKNIDIMTNVYGQSRYAPISTGVDLADKLAVKTDELFSYYKTDKRTVTEPPMPGYTGYIPKINPTELGLGARYHATTERGLRQFANEYQRYKNAENSSLKSVQFSEPNGENSAYSDSSMPTISTGGKRVYIKPGMLPQYTGYVHGHKFEFGNTYGDTTRDLPVCSHDMENYGAYMQTRGTKTFIC